MKPLGRRRKAKNRETISPVQDLDIDTTCLVCQAEFLDSEDLRVHIAQVHPFTTSKGYTCTLCTTTLLNVIDYLCHVRDDHFSNLKCCMYCSRGFLDNEELTEHELKHTSGMNNMFSCSHCSIFFSDIKILESHEVTHHSDSKHGIMLQNHYPLLTTLLNMKAQTFMQTLCSDAMFVCAKCKFASPDVVLHLNHLKIGTCRTYACDKCSNVFTFKLSLMKHFEFHPECGQIFDPSKLTKKCTECKNQFSIADFRIHMKKCRLIKCSSCNIVFKTVKELTQHQNNEHPLTISLKKCRYCQQEMVGPVAFRKHMERHHRQDYHLYKYKCLQCSAIFKHPKNFLGHVYSKHRSIKPFWCKICDERWRIRKSFTIHIKMKHNSKGFVQFDKDMNVHFSDKKSDPVILPDNPSLYNEEEAKNLPPVETDYETDMEKSNKKSLKKTSEKIKRISNKDITIVTTDISSETDADLVADTETVQQNSKSKILTRKRKAHFDTDSSDDEPLLAIKTLNKIKKMKARQSIMKNKSKRQGDVPKRLTCHQCKKYCFTVDNYNRHMKLHFKNKSKQCIKCAKLFSTVEELNKHMKIDHATAHITETLKRLLERRNKVIVGINDETSVSKKFKRTVKKVALPQSTSTATLKKTDKGLSVKNFLESFTPDDAKVTIDNIVNIKPVKNMKTQPIIKMTKFKEEKCTTMPFKLKMPVKFNKNYTEIVSATIKMVQEPVNKPKLDFGKSIYETDDVTETDYYEDEYAEEPIDYNMEEDHTEVENAQYSIIPEVAQEVMLENTEQEMPNTFQQVSKPHEITIPGVESIAHNLQIAHLQPQAPYFKIIKYNDIIHPKSKVKEEELDIEDVMLPSGRRLINTNPLEHLLGDKKEELFKNAEKKKKYYKYKPKTNLKKALADALIKLETPTVIPKRVLKPKRKYEPRVNPSIALANALAKFNKPPSQVLKVKKLK